MKKLYEIKIEIQKWDASKRVEIEEDILVCRETRCISGKIIIENGWIEGIIFEPSAERAFLVGQHSYNIFIEVTKLINKDDAMPVIFKCDFEENKHVGSYDAAFQGVEIPSGNCLILIEEIASTLEEIALFEAEILDYKNNEMSDASREYYNNDYIVKDELTSLKTYKHLLGDYELTCPRTKLFLERTAELERSIDYIRAQAKKGHPLSKTNGNN